MGYQAVDITRIDESSAEITFKSTLTSHKVKHKVVAGPNTFSAFPPTTGDGDLLVSPRFMAILTTFLQIHTLGSDISYVPPILPSTASCSTSHLIQVFAKILGYELETMHLYKELGGRELVMRRRIEHDGSTSWEARLVK
jgi:hypothetical protein